MAYCKYCGTNNTESAKYCTNCGAPMMTGRSGETYGGPQMQQGAREMQQTAQRQQWEEEHVQSQGHWVLDTFLICIPLVGLILLIVWSVTDQPDLSKQRWARAQLLWMVIGILATIVFIVLFGALLAGLGAAYF